RAVAPPGVDAALYEGLATLPWFNPDDDPDGGPVHPAVADLRAQISASGALLFCTPEYAGALPGSFKNLLDWTVGGGETYGKPVGWINVSGPASPTGAAGAHGSLREVLTYPGTDNVEARCGRLPVVRAAGAVRRAGPRCRSTDPRTVICDAAAAYVNTGDGADTVSVLAINGAFVSVRGVDGNDTLTGAGSLAGGPGRDVVTGSEQR